MGLANQMYAGDNDGFIIFACVKNSSGYITWDDCLGIDEGRNRTTAQMTTEKNRSTASAIYRCPAYPHWYGLTTSGAASLRPARSYTMNSDSTQGGFSGDGGVAYVDTATYDYFALKQARIPNPSKVIEIAEYARKGNYLGDPSNASRSNTVAFQLQAPTTMPTHGKWFNYLFCDGNAKSMMPLNTKSPNLWTRKKDD